MTKTVNTDQTAPKGAVWSGFTLFAWAYLPEYLWGKDDISKRGQ